MLKDEKHGPKRRIPFDVPALVLVFSSSVYVEGKRPKAGAGEAAYWLPLLALLTGARVEELGQLRPEDLRQESYRDAAGNDAAAWIIDITDEGPGQDLKNPASRRRVPVHAELIRLGFIDFARSQDGKARIFHQLKADITARKRALGLSGSVAGSVTSARFPIREWYFTAFGTASKITAERQA